MKSSLREHAERARDHTAQQIGGVMESVGEALEVTSHSTHPFLSFFLPSVLSSFLPSFLPWMHSDICRCALYYGDIVSFDHWLLHCFYENFNFVFI